MTVINNVKSKLTVSIVPDWCLWSATAILGFAVVINISTTLLFGFGENYTSIKTAIICGIILAILMLCGFGIGVTTEIIFKDTFNIIIYHRTKDIIKCEKDENQVKVIYLTYSKDLIVKFKRSLFTYKIRINNDINTSDTEAILDGLRKTNVNIRLIDDSTENKRNRQ